MDERDESRQKKPGGVAAAYQLDFAEPVWQLRFDDVAGLVGVECRDSDALQTSFSAFEVTTGQLLLHQYRPVSGWWTGLEDIRGGVMYLHGLKAAGFGQHTGITAVAVKTGEVIWQQADYRFYGLTDEQVLALPAKPDATELIGLNIGAGKVLGNVADSNEARAALERLRVHRQRNVRLPAHYPEQSAYFEDLSSFIFTQTGFTAQLAIDYLETEKYFLTGFYPTAANGEKRYLLNLFPVAGNLLLQEELGKERTGIGTDNFFIFRDTLILLKDARSLVAYVI